MKSVLEKDPVQKLPDAPNNVVVETQGTITGAAIPDEKVKKVIVAVHGVGDQHTFATLQSVVNQFCGFFGEPTAIPLGSFHTGNPTFSILPPYPEKHFRHMAFAEVYWAKIPRETVSDKHTLEEAKRWANTIVERLRLRWKEEKKKCQGEEDTVDCKDSDFILLKQVFKEMIQTIAVLERLCYLTERAGLFTFDLGKLLNDYLGDVQIVAEFGVQRGKIVQTFFDVLEKVHKIYPNAEIHLVAHSEGTVISFLALLKAIRQPARAPWIENVRSFMTIGSPLDKHLILWPELFESKLPAQWPKDREKIEWRNYYDHGDPIGFELDDTRTWLKSNNWNDVFDFKPEHDMGFSRYAFPGKAHVDYWEDEKVFGHFIQTVINKPIPISTNLGGNLSVATDFSKPPRDKQLEKWMSYILPYAGVAVLLFVAVYILFKAVFGYIDPTGKFYGSNSDWLILKQVAGTAILLVGVTVTSRIPRLTRDVLLRLVAWLIYALCVTIYLLIIPTNDLPEKGLKIWIESYWNLPIPPGGIRVLVATLMVGIVYWVSKTWPLTGVSPLLILGTTATLGIIGYHIATNSIADDAALWPVLLAAAGFFYVWWLAALVFDLVFVWHVYIRQSIALKRMDELVRSKARPSTPAMFGAALNFNGSSVK